MAVPTVMRWDHKNAPQIIDMRDWTQIKNWYQTIFVDGYLADDDVTLIPPLDWEVIFNDASYIVDLRADVNGLNDGSINRMRIYAEYYNVVVSGYHGGRVRTWIHNGLTQLNATSNISNSLYGAPTWFGNNNMSTTRACPWIVIGNNRGVYFLGGYNGNTTYPLIPTQFSTSNDYSTWQYFGDFINDGIDYGKDNQCCTYGYNGTLGSTTKYYANRIDSLSYWRYTAGLNRRIDDDYENQYLGIHVVKDELGALRGTNFTATPFGFIAGSQYLGATGIYDLLYPYIDGGLKIVPFDLWIRNNLDVIVGNTINGVYIGKMPGLYFPMHHRPLTTVNNLVEFEGTGEYENQHFIGLAKYNFDEFYINITEDWGI